MRVGFIGLGLMGRPMAMHLLAAGHELQLWARRAATLDAFRDGMARLHDSPAAVARASEVVITMVGDAPDVAEIAFGRQGIARGAARDLIFVDMSTIAPAAARDIAGKLGARGIEFLDAPVSGGETGARNAALTIMVGGKPEVFEKIRPLFEVLGQSVTLVGEAGAGQVAKACNQILTGVGIAAVAEALVFAEKNGVDAAKVRKALLGGFAYSRILEHHGQRMLARDFTPGFKAWMQGKDLRIVMEEAHRLGLMLPNAAMAAQWFNALVGCGMGEEDTVAILKLLERTCGAKGA